jgi:hypothetical protein
LAENGVNKTDTNLCSNYQRIGLVEEKSVSNVSVYPDPSSDMVKINWNETDVNELSMYTINGTLVYSQFIPRGTNQLELNLTLEAGVYSIRMKSDEKELVQKWVKL